MPQFQINTLSVFLPRRRKESVTQTIILNFELPLIRSVSSPSIITTQRVEHVKSQADTSEEIEVGAPLVRNIRTLLHDHRCSVSLCGQGVGGTYFLSNEHGNKIAVFKPTDEEPGAPLNPKGLISDPLLPPGQGSSREIIAHLLDQNHRAGVPETHLVDDIVHESWPTPKSGSLQRFIPHEALAADMGSSLFSVDNVHYIGILDIRLLNLDRNGENMLVVREKIDGVDNYRLVPIDHSYILPPSVQNPMYEWLHWKQVKVPFSPEIRKYISDLDIDQDVNILQSFDLDEKSILVFMLSSILLKKGAEMGLTLFDIAQLVCTNDESQKSLLAQLFEEAEKKLGEKTTGGEVVVDAPKFRFYLENLVNSSLCKLS